MQFEIFLTPDQIKAIRAGDNRILVDEDQSEGLIESYFEGKEAECSASFPFEMFDADTIAEHCVGKPIEILRHTINYPRGRAPGFVTVHRYWRPDTASRL